jgi:hypothetical protein
MYASNATCPSPIIISASSSLPRCPVLSYPELKMGSEHSTVASKPPSPPPSSAAAQSPSSTRHSRRVPRLRPLPARKASLRHLERWGGNIKPKSTVAAVADAPSRTRTPLSFKPPRNPNPTKTGGIRLARSCTGLELILIPPRAVDSAHRGRS